MATLLRGSFDVARSTGRVVVGSGAVFSDIWSFDLRDTPVRARRLTQGTNWHGYPVMPADGSTIYFLRADPIGNSLYKTTESGEVALTAERQAVDNIVRLSRDQRHAIFESTVDSAAVLVIHDLAAGTSRRVRRAPDDLGWVLPGGNEIVWLGADRRSLWLTDGSGAGRREVAALGEGRSLATESMPVAWFLAPDGESVAVLLRFRGETTLYRVPLHGGAPVIIGRFPLADGPMGIASWNSNEIVLARRNYATGGTTLLRHPATAGTTRLYVELPTACLPTGVTMAANGTRAACLVRDQRTDLILIDGLRP
jgi:hypothetical protein